jgi:hypothetical protein
MTDVIVCKPMQDEPVWGQFIRLARLNGLNSRRSLAKLIPMDAPFGHEGWATYRKRVTYLLSGTRCPMQLQDYFRLHYVHPLIVSAHYWFGPHQSAFYAWNAHHCIYYPSSRVVRSCGNCAQEQIEGYGFAWFKRTHQLPGMSWCWEHRSLLHERNVLNDLFQSDGWMALRPQTRRFGSETMQPFVGRYIRVLDWLGGPDGCWKWRHLWRALIDTLRISQRESDPEWAFDELISAEAPVTWHETNFLTPRRKPRPYFYCRRHDDAPLLALSAAAITRSDRDVDELIDRTNEVHKEAQESVRRWFKEN